MAYLLFQTVFFLFFFVHKVTCSQTFILFYRDGFDVAGYDASGYDRYGFNLQGKTPFGFFYNGSFDPSADEGYAGSLFDDFGYNRYGFSPFGLDQRG